MVALSVISVMAGAFYGLTFGCMDIEDMNEYRGINVIIRELKYCLVLGSIFGAIGGAMSELLRQNVNYFLKVKSK